jgi:hypothetical protein
MVRRCMPEKKVTTEADFTAADIYWREDWSLRICWITKKDAIVARQTIRLEAPSLKKKERKR